MLTDLEAVFRSFKSELGLRPSRPTKVLRAMPWRPKIPLP